MLFVPIQAIHTLHFLFRQFPPSIFPDVILFKKPPTIESTLREFSIVMNNAAILKIPGDSAHLPLAPGIDTN